MDVFDLKILNLIQKNNRLPTEKIADEIGLSPSAVQRRLKYLRKTGIIAADVSIVSPEAVGKSILAIVEVNLTRNLRAAIGIQEFKEAMIAAPEVMQCFLVTGTTDFILLVAVKDVQEYEKFTTRYFLESSNVSGFHTSIVINKVKYGLEIPLVIENIE